MFIIWQTTTYDSHWNSTSYVSCNQAFLSHGIELLATKVCTTKANATSHEGLHN